VSWAGSAGTTSVVRARARSLSASRRDVDLCGGNAFVAQPEGDDGGVHESVATTQNYVHATSRSKNEPGPHHPDRRRPRPLPAHRHDHQLLNL